MADYCLKSIAGCLLFDGRMLFDFDVWLLFEVDCWQSGDLSFCIDETRASGGGGQRRKKQY